MAAEEQKQLIELLAQLSPFDSLDGGYVDKVAEHVRKVDVAKGKLIFRRGKAAEFRYYLLKGQVDLVDANFTTVSRRADDDQAGHPLTTTSPTQVSAVAKSEVQLLEVDADFLDLTLAMSQSPKEAKEIKRAESVKEIQAQELGGVNLAEAHIEVDEHDDEDWLSTLLTTPLFTRVPPAHIQQLFFKFSALDVKAGDTVIKEGDSGDYFYVIEQGQAHVTSMTGHVDIILGKGDYFGEEALVGETKRNASITMKTDGRLQRLGKDDFTTLLHEPAQQQLSWSELEALPTGSYQLVDVRLPMEFRHQHLQGCRNLPLMTLRQKIEGLDKGMRYVVADDAGRRSQLAAYLMYQAGLDTVILEGASQHYG